MVGGWEMSAGKELRRMLRLSGMPKKPYIYHTLPYITRTRDLLTLLLRSDVLMARSSGVKGWTGAEGSKGCLVRVGAEWAEWVEGEGASPVPRGRFKT